MIPSQPIPNDLLPSSLSVKQRQSGQVIIPDEREEVVWEKVLWRKQPFPDNHVPPSFLSELNDIPARPRPRLINLVIAALPILQHLSTVFLFLGVFNALLDDRIGAAQLGWTCFGLGGVGYCVFRFGWGVKERDAVEGYIPHPTPLRQLILPPLLLSLLSPILKSLTSSTSSDSIWPLSGLLFVVHLLLADFSTGEDSRKQSRRRRRLREVWRVKERRASLGANGDMPKAEERRYVLEEKSLTSSLSLTSALSASIVLSSRLPTTSHVFSFILLSVLLFSGWPNIAKGVRESGKIWSIGLTGSMALLAFSFLPGYEDLGLGGNTCGVLFVGVLGLVGLVGPLGVWAGWRWKTVRGGGWDAAKVTLKRRASMRR